MTDLSKLNWQQIQEALYEAHSKADKPETHDEGMAEITALYDEYARRGVVKVIRPDAR